MNTIQHKYVKIIVLLVTALFSMSMQAQDLGNIFVEAHFQGGVIKAGNVTIYTFKTKKQAEAAQDLLANGQVEKVRKMNGFIAENITDAEGGCYIKMAKDGWMVLDPIKLNMEIEVGSTKPNASGDVKYMLGNASAKSDEKTVHMKDVDVSGKRSLLKEPVMAKAKSCGDNITIGATAIDVDSLYAHEDARFIVAPVIYKDDKPFLVLPPTVLDGKPYRDTQTRRMDYNYSNDPLYSYIDQEQYMETHKPTLVYTKEVSFTKEKGCKYKGVARRSYENYREVYHEDSYEFWDGLLRDPMRFLDWEAVKRSIPIEATRYSRVGRAEKTTATMQGLTVNYAVGSKELNMSDSLTQVSIEQIQRQIKAYYGGDSYIDKMVIKGYASPEGNYNSNLTLSRERARTLTTLVTHQYGDRALLRQVVSEGYVTPWTDVAKYLDENIGSDYAKEVAAEMRDIIKATSNMDQQYAKIRTQEWYKYVNENVLPHMRRTDVEFTYVTDRVKTPEEIRETYLEKGEAYLNVAKEYEFYELLKMYSEEDDLDNLERIAKIALKSVHENAVQHYREVQKVNKDGSREFYLKPGTFYQREYPFAAYCLAKCKFMRHEIDTTTLTRHIDWCNDGKEFHKFYGGLDCGWWNDEAIVVLQVLMLCEAKAYHKAHEMCFYHLGDDPRFTALKMFVRAMDCEYDVPEVKEFIAQSSPLNRAVVTLADETDPDHYKVALNVLNNDPGINADDPNVMYMKAICRFNTEAREDESKPSALPFFVQNIYLQNEEDAENYKDFCAPMLDVFRVAPKMVEELQNDGYFNKSYRQIVLFFWKGIKEGMTMEQIGQRWTTIRNKWLADQKEKEKQEAGR